MGMNGEEFDNRLLGLRHIVKAFVESDLDKMQFTYLGAELQDWARVIIEKFALQGYLRRD